MSVSLDRFSHGPADPANAEVMAYCEACGGEIYAGEDVYVVGNCIIHDDWDCLVQFIDPEWVPIEKALGVEK